jgi:hypothetical protein
MMFELICRRVKEQNPQTFDEFHAIMCKSMPDASRYPDMYNLCYDLMKFTWETAQKSA